MKLRFPALLLAISLLITAPAIAASDSMKNFAREKAYAGQFSDLTTASVFYDNVAALYEYGLSVGKADGTFGLADSVTLGQILIFSGRIRSLYRTGNAETGPQAYQIPAGEVAAPYLRYLQAEGVVGSELGASFSAPATRAQVAHILANTLPAETLPPINDALVSQGYASRRFLTDVTEYTPYYEDILFLYRCGISVGSDAAGSFLPDAPITRGAAAAMLTRVVDASLRLTPQWSLVDYTPAAGATLAGLVAPGAPVTAPATPEQMDESVRYMLSSGSATLSLQYPSVTALSARSKMEEALSVVKSYCEQSYNTVSCTYFSNGSLTMTFSAAGSNGRIEEYRTAAVTAAAAAHDELWRTGAITADMTETEKARVYYTWVCDNCQYDYDASDDSLSHIPYNLFVNGLAVCDGYTGAYNLLLKLEGIECTALSNPGHIWTVATLDGTQVHIDTTWGDSASAVSYDYFAMTPEQSWGEHRW